MNISIEKNINFQQCGDNIVTGLYVNESFINIKVEKKLSKEELQKLANQVYEFCINNEFIRPVIEGIAKEYEDNPNRDGQVFFIIGN